MFCDPRCTINFGVPPMLKLPTCHTQSIHPPHQPSYHRVHLQPSQEVVERQRPNTGPTTEDCGITQPSATTPMLKQRPTPPTTQPSQTASSQRPNRQQLHSATARVFRHTCCVQYAFAVSRKTLSLKANYNVVPLRDNVTKV
eukprot:TRINITY_DN23131_c0_g1_i1.p1 TRINITY_DN23131_c0_g1~~TRINITY_DN23131_c0_g1_i1.p1  ORF type:complete len:142 (+),score=3.46 TRINITY_DN23131_c0_g1_i1:132-557(+)